MLVCRRNKESVSQVLRKRTYFLRRVNKYEEKNFVPGHGTPDKQYTDYERQRFQRRGTSPGT